MLIDLFLPQEIEQFYPNIGIATTQILTKLGIEVNYNENQTSCGELAFFSGHWEDAKLIGEKFIKDFSQNRPIICPSFSSVHFVQNYFDELFYNSALHIEYHQLKANFFELTDFIVNKLNKTELGANFIHTVATCFSSEQIAKNNDQTPAKILLSKVEGARIVETSNTIADCNFAERNLNKNLDHIFLELLSEKVQLAIEHKAEYIVCNDSNVILQLDSYINAKQLPIKTIHIAEVLV